MISTRVIGFGVLVQYDYRALFGFLLNWVSDKKRFRGDTTVSFWDTLLEKGARLKFFKDGKFILELKKTFEGKRIIWISVHRKTYWSPQDPIPEVSSNPQQISTLLSEDNSSWQSSRDHLFIMKSKILIKTFLKFNILWKAWMVFIFKTVVIKLIMEAVVIKALYTDHCVFSLMSKILCNRTDRVF